MKQLIIIIVVLVILYGFNNLHSKNDRQKKIDFLNVNVGNFNGVWVTMEQDELNHVYKSISLVKSGVKLPEQDALMLDSILEKYNISFS